MDLRTNNHYIPHTVYWCYQLTHSDFWAVQTPYLNTIQANLSSYMTVPWISRLVAGPSPRKHRFEPKSREQSGSETGFYPSTSIVSYHYHCTNSPCTASSICCS
jgi:hypothetical protein